MVVVEWNMGSRKVYYYYYYYYYYCLDVKLNKQRQTLSGSINHRVPASRRCLQFIFVKYIVKGIRTETCRFAKAAGGKDGQWMQVE